MHKHVQHIHSQIHTHTHPKLTHKSLQRICKNPASPAVFKASENLLRNLQQSPNWAEQSSHAKHFFLKQPPGGCLTKPEITPLHSETDTIRNTADTTVGLLLLHSHCCVWFVSVEEMSTHSGKTSPVGMTEITHLNNTETTQKSTKYSYVTFVSPS